MCGYDDANVHADPASLVLSGRVRGPGQVDRFQLGEEIEIFVHLYNGIPHAIENGKLGGCAGSGECSVRGIHKVPDRLPLVRLFQRTEADLIFGGSSEMDDPHFFALLRGEGAHGKVQRGDAGAFSGGAEGMGSVRRSRSPPGFLTLTVLAVNLSVQGDPGQKRRQCQRCHE